jgi:hypothetical protein
MSEAGSHPEKTSLRKQVQAMLRHEDSVSLRGSLGRLFKGIGVCILVGIVFATSLTFGLQAMLHRSPLGWFTWFWIYCVLLVVLMILVQRRRHTEYVVASLTADPLEAMASPRRSPYLQAIVWGPKSVLDGISAVRGKWTATQNAKFKRAAQMVLEMSKYDGGVEVRALMHPPEDMAVFNEVIDWLDAHDYLGKSSDGERFWLTTIGKKKMNEHGISATPRAV